MFCFPLPRFRTGLGLPASGAARITLLLALWLLATLPAVHAAQIRLVNGDQLTGTILRLDQEQLVFDSELAGRLTIPRGHIQSLTSETPLLIRLTNGAEHNGPISAERTPAALLSSHEERRFDLAMIRAINPEPVPAKVWAGDLTFGASLKGGNSDKIGFSAGINASRRDLPHRFVLGLVGKYAETEGQVTTRNAYANLRYDYFLTPRFYPYLSAELLYDTFKNLELRSAIGPGTGYQFWDTPRSALAVETGVAFFHEKHQSGPDQSWASGRLAGHFRYAFSNNLSISEQLLIYPSLARLGQFTLRNEAAVKTPLSYGWALRLASIIEHDSHPDLGVKRTDFDLTMGLQYSY